MRKIRMEALSYRDGKYWFDGRLFSGVGLATKRGIELDIIAMLDGVVCRLDEVTPMATEGYSLVIDVSGYTDDDLVGSPIRHDEGENGLIVHWEELQLRLSYLGVPYSGRAFEFDEETCVRELDYENGYVIKDARQDKAGALLDLYIGGEFEQFYSWDSHGALESAELIVKKSDLERGIVVMLQVMIGFTGDKMSDLTLVGKAEAINDLIKRASYFPVENVEEIASFPTAVTFNFFSGDGNFDLLEQLVSRGKLSATIDLGLPSKFLLSPRVLDVVGSLVWLERIQFFSMGIVLPDTIEELKGKMPSTKIYADCESEGPAGVSHLTEPASSLRSGF